jgi:hypothetical protein
MEATSNTRPKPPQIVICLCNCGDCAKQAGWPLYCSLNTSAPPSLDPEITLGVWIPIRPCLLVRYFLGSEGNFPAHSLIPEFPDRPVYYSGISEFYPGPSRPIPPPNPRHSGIPTRDPVLVYLPGRLEATARLWRLEATARSHGAGRDACLGTSSTGITSNIGSGFSPVSSRTSSPLLPSLLASRFSWLPSGVHGGGGKPGSR